MRLSTFCLLLSLFAFGNLSAQLANPVFVKYQGNVDNPTGVKQAVAAFPVSATFDIPDGAVVTYDSASQSFTLAEPAATGGGSAEDSAYVFIGYVTQSGIGAPVIHQIYSTFDVAITGAFQSTGVYTLTITDFDIVANEMAVVVTRDAATSTNGLLFATPDATNDYISISNFNLAGSAANGANFSIIVYAKK